MMMLMKTARLKEMLPQSVILRENQYISGMPAGRGGRHTDLSDLGQPGRLSPPRHPQSPAQHGQRPRGTLASHCLPNLRKHSPPHLLQQEGEFKMSLLTFLGFSAL